MWLVAYLLAIQTRLVRLDDNVFLARDVHARTLHLLGHTGIGVRAYDLLEFLGRDVEGGGGSPDGGAFGVEDCGAVDVLGAEEAGGEVISIIAKRMGRARGLWVNGESRRDEITCCRRMLWEGAR